MILMEINFGISEITSIVSCLFTVLALCFTLYFWTIDNRNDDEISFFEKKRTYIQDLLMLSSKIKECNKATEDMAMLISDANDILQIIMHYRFWSNRKENDMVAIIQKLYEDGYYFVSEIERSVKVSGEEKKLNSMLDMDYNNINNKLLIRTRDDYLERLDDIIVFLKRVH